MSLFRNILSLLKIYPVKSAQGSVPSWQFNRVEKWPSKLQWRQFFKVLTKKERNLFLIFLILGFFSFIFLISTIYFKNTRIKPCQGGTHIEGVIGQPRFINPIYANSDADRDLVQLVFSGLMKYNEKMEIVPDLVSKYEIEEDGRIYKFYLKENLLWQDKFPLTADDVIFTIKTIQNQEYKSPIRANWLGVEVEKISDFGVKFSLKQPYSAFIENSTIKILPEHIWKNITPQNFPFEIYNLKPIGSGPYKVKEISSDKKNQVKSLILVKNPNYFGKEPYISEIKFLFFDNEKELIKAAKSEEIKGFSLSSPQKINGQWQSYFFSLPRYFAVFFNRNKIKALDDEKVRVALNYGTNKKEIIEILAGSEDSIATEIVNSPVLPEIYGLQKPTASYDFNIEEAKKILDEAGYKDQNGDGVREKIIKKEFSFKFKSDLQLNSKGTEVEELQKCLAKFPDIYPSGEITGTFSAKTQEGVIKFQEKYAKEILEPAGFTKGTGLVSKNTRNKLNEVCFGDPNETLTLKFSLATVDQPQMVQVADILKNQWKVLGIELEIKKMPIDQLEQDYIKPRNYESLLFGEVLGAIPDPFPFWHSSQKKEPGLNLAIYENKDADKLLEENRTLLDWEGRKEKLNLFQNILIKDAAAVFLYDPDYLYWASKEIKGINIKKITDPSKRFLDIENWYIKTRRVWK